VCVIICKIAATHRKIAAFKLVALVLAQPVFSLQRLLQKLTRGGKTPVCGATANFSRMQKTASRMMRKMAVAAGWQTHAET
jgi:hypothetical protein